MKFEEGHLLQPFAPGEGVDENFSKFAINSSHIGKQSKLSDPTTQKDNGKCPASCVK